MRAWVLAGEDILRLVGVQTPFDDGAFQQVARSMHMPQLYAYACVRKPERPEAHLRPTHKLDDAGLAQYLPLLPAKKKWLPQACFMDDCSKEFATRALHIEHLRGPHKLSKEDAHKLIDERATFEDVVPAPGYRRDNACLALQCCLLCSSLKLYLSTCSRRRPPYETRLETCQGGVHIPAATPTTVLRKAGCLPG